MKYLIELRMVATIMFLGFCALTPSSFAQARNFMADSAYGQFNKEDIKLLQATITKAHDSSSVNETLNWNNSESGAKGSVTLTERLSEDGRPCAWIKLVNEAKDKKGTSKFLWCKIESGEWKILR